MNHKAKKSLGQNFLTSKAIVEKIVAAGNITPDDTVLEIGPGKGVLTERLLAAGGKVVAIEKDPDLVELLKGKFQNEIKKGYLEIISGDVLTFDPKKNSSLSGKYKIVANIPYYITGEIVRQFLTTSHQPESMVILVQKEVADRVVARDGKESILSLSVKVFGTPKVALKVPKKYFSPQPKVDSAVLVVTHISRNNLPTHDSEKRFFEIVKTGFSQKRKQLIGLLSSYFTKEELKDFLITRGYTEKVRAEDVHLSDWLELSKK